MSKKSRKKFDGIWANFCQERLNYTSKILFFNIWKTPSDWKKISLNASIWTLTSPKLRKNSNLNVASSLKTNCLNISSTPSQCWFLLILSIKSSNLRFNKPWKLMTKSRKSETLRLSRKMTKSHLLSMTKCSTRKTLSSTITVRIKWISKTAAK